MVNCISCKIKVSEEQFNNFDRRCDECAKKDKLEMNHKKSVRGLLKEKIPPEHLNVNCYLCEKEIEEEDSYIEKVYEAVYTCDICSKPVCNSHHEDRDKGILCSWKQFRPVCDKCNTKYLIYSIMSYLGIAMGIGVLIGLAAGFGWFG